MLISYTQLLIDERGFSPVYDILQNTVRIIQAQYILLFHQCFELTMKFIGNSETIHLPLEQEGSIIDLVFMIEQ